MNKIEQYMKEASDAVTESMKDEENLSTLVVKQLFQTGKVDTATLLGACSEVAAEQVLIKLLDESLTAASQEEVEEEAPA